MAAKATVDLVVQMAGALIVLLGGVAVGALSRLTGCYTAWSAENRVVEKTCQYVSVNKSS